MSELNTDYNNTDYNNTELLDQELTDDQLELVAGGNDVVRFGYEVARSGSPAIRIGEWIAGGRYPWQ